MICAQQNSSICRKIDCTIGCIVSRMIVCVCVRVCAYYDLTRDLVDHKLDGLNALNYCVR